MKPLHRSTGRGGSTQLVAPGAIAATLRNALACRTGSPPPTCSVGPAGHRQDLQCPDPGPFRLTELWRQRRPHPRTLRVCEICHSIKPQATPSM